MPDSPWDWNLQRTIPSSLDAGHQLIECYLKILDQFGWEGGDLFHVQLAVEEAIVNAITHGNQQSPDKTVEIEFKVSRNETIMRIRDEGPGFCPDSLPDPTSEELLDVPHGRGVMLIRQTMTSVEFNAAGNQVTMVKRRAFE